MHKFQHLYNFKVPDDNTVCYTVCLTRVLNRVMLIFSSFMFAYQIRNPVHLLESQPFSCGSPHHIINQLWESSPYTFLFLLRESPPFFSFSLAGVPAHLGLHSFQFHQFHPNLISKDEENSWSFTVIHNLTFHHNFI